jgi:hypothetical protein
LRARTATSRSGCAEDGWKVQDLIGDAAIRLAGHGRPLPLAAMDDGVAGNHQSSRPAPDEQRS